MADDLKRLIRREINYRKDDLVARVVTAPELEDLDGNGSAVWTISVAIRGARTFKHVPIKASGSGSRFFAQVGQTVLLRQNAQGLYDCIGPADRRIAFTEVKVYQIGNTTPISETQEGTAEDCVDYDFYQNDRPGSGGTESLYNDGVTDYPLCRVVDPAGNEVT